MKLREWRNSQGLSLQQVAEVLATNKSYLSLIENGKSFPGRDFAKRIELMTKGAVTAAELLGLDQREQKQRSVSEDRTEFSGLLSKSEPELLVEAAIYGIDAEAVARQAIENAVKAERIRRWNEENREAIESWNDLVEREGLWSDGIRAF
ncbi:MAG: type II toxin-antitoxin system CcdA family antitoxin [Hyphomonas sp.]|uniref:type II toxin-antitoxin system CcdA family antitoxin n=1 Tax=Hyphomonas sp. TaxID=87 RepID=UPI0035276214